MVQLEKTGLIPRASYAARRMSRPDIQMRFKIRFKAIFFYSKQTGKGTKITKISSKAVFGRYFFSEIFMEQAWISENRLEWLSLAKQKNLGAF